jgi:protein involved in polysaccharide export with SLBB domain
MSVRGDDMNRGIGFAAAALRSGLRRFCGAAGAVVLLFAVVSTASCAERPNTPLSAVGSTAAAALPKGISTAPPADYRLGSGDDVRVTVFGQKDLTGIYTVDGAGMLAFPLIGAVKAGGLTVTQLQAEIAHKLSPDYIKDPSVAAEVLTHRPFYIVGEVQKPGSYPYVSGMSVINAVALAGGFTYRAKENSFYLDRREPDGKRERVDATPDTSVEPGDVITVRERWW